MRNETLIAARKQSGKTQVQVANETKLTERTYQKYESGMSSKTIQTAIRIAKALGTTVENLWGFNTAADCHSVRPDNLTTR